MGAESKGRWASAHHWAGVKEPWVVVRPQWEWGRRSWQVAGSWGGEFGMGGHGRQVFSQYTCLGIGVGCMSSLMAGRTPGAARLLLRPGHTGSSSSNWELGRGLKPRGWNGIRLCPRQGGGGCCWVWQEPLGWGKLQAVHQQGLQGTGGQGGIKAQQQGTSIQATHQIRTKVQLVGRLWGRGQGWKTVQLTGKG